MHGLPNLKIFPSGYVRINSSKHFCPSVPFQCGWFLETVYKSFLLHKLNFCHCRHRTYYKQGQSCSKPHTHFPFLLRPSELSRVVTLLSSTWKVLCSNLDRDTDCTFVPVHIMKVYRGRRGIAPLTSILNVCEWSASPSSRFDSR